MAPKRRKRDVIGDAPHPELKGRMVGWQLDRQPDGVQHLVMEGGSRDGSKGETPFRFSLCGDRRYGYGPLHVIEEIDGKRVPKVIPAKEGSLGWPKPAGYCRPCFQKGFA